MEVINKIIAKLGTDVKYRFKFVDNNGQPMTIMAVHGIFVNRTLHEKLTECSAKDNLHRYPIEPRCAYDATEYTLNQSGRYGYHTMPIQAYKHPKFKPVLEFPATIQYTNSSDTVDVIFLADGQIEPGIYDLHLFVRCVEDDKFRENNIRKFSISYESILQLDCKSTATPQGISDIQVISNPYDGKIVDSVDYVYSDEHDDSAVVYSSTLNKDYVCVLD